MLVCGVGDDWRVDGVSAGRAVCFHKNKSTQIRSWKE